MRQWGEFHKIYTHNLSKREINIVKKSLLKDYTSWPIPKNENVVYAEWIIKEYIEDGVLPVTSVALKITTDGDGNVV